MKQQDLKPALMDLGFEIKSIPTSLFKYTGCNEKDKESKLGTLKSKEVWLSFANNLNDPFEGLSLYVDKLKLEEHSSGHEDINEVYKGLKGLGSVMLVGSFAASNLKEDMPLWAHYAYDHKGYCLEYEVIDNTYIYPVLYESRRHLATKTLSDFLMDAKKLRATEESMERFLVIWSSFMIKHTVWQYEKEYRILKYEANKDKSDLAGRCFSEEELGLKLKSIYIGEKCPYKNELIEIARERGCETYQMVLNPYEGEFKLLTQKI
ncbi:MAG: hypothetical protein K0S71_1689 [Clostridia bacterium]|nr:hypothetical protein [Clostridia bacterium]